MATTTRPFNITESAPKTSADARALATVLAEQESLQAKAQRLARSDAMFSEAQQVLAVDAVKAADDRDAANAAWEAAAADPAVGIQGLFSAFVSMKAASAKRAAIVSQGSAIQGLSRPKRNEFSGAPEEYRHDVADSLLRADWSAAVDDCVRARVDHAAQIARNEVQRRCTDAADDAAAKA